MCTTEMIMNNLSASCTESAELHSENPVTFRGSSFHNLGYCRGFELLSSLWLPMTLYYSYGRTMSSARRLILLYDFLSQGEGGRLPVSCPDCSDCMNSWWSLKLLPNLSFFVCLFVLSSQYQKPHPFSLLNQVLCYQCLYSLQSPLIMQAFSSPALQMCSQADSWPPWQVFIH